MRQRRRSLYADLRASCVCATRWRARPEVSDEGADGPHGSGRRGPLVRPVARLAGDCAPATVVEEPAPTGAEVRMLAVGQYDPEEVTISAGGSVTFLNAGEIATVVIVKGDSGTDTSALIQPGDKFEYEFIDAGDYEAWGISYGPVVSVTVE